jgi:hypothetical protein
MRQRTMPEVDPAAVAAGLAIAILVAVGGAILGFAPIVSLIGLAAGGYAAGRIAGRDGLFHGAIVGTLSIIVASVAASAGNSTVANVLVDTLTIVVSDVLFLLCASVGGWLATRS